MLFSASNNFEKAQSSTILWEKPLMLTVVGFIISYPSLWLPLDQIKLIVSYKRQSSTAPVAKRTKSICFTFYCAYQCISLDKKTHAGTQMLRRKYVHGENKIFNTAGWQKKLRSTFLYLDMKTYVFPAWKQKISAAKCTKYFIEEMVLSAWL